MIRVVLLIALLGLQIRPPSTLRQPATPPAEGTGTFQQHSYTFKRESIYYVLEFTPMLPAKRATVLEAMKAACQGLYDLDFKKVTPRPGPAPDEWILEMKDLRACYARQMPSPVATGEIKTIKVWMP